MGQFVSMQVAAVTGLVSLGYLAFGGYLLSRYEGIGVRSLSLFLGLWGGNFLSAAVVIFAFSSFGITNGAQLTQLGSQVPPTLQPLLISVDFLAGLFTVSGIFVWLWFVLQYTQRIGRREKIAIGGLGGGTFLISAANGLTGAAAAFGVIALQPTFRTSIHQFATVFEVLGTSVAIGVGIALLYTTATRHHPFRGRSVIGLSLAVVFPWLVGYLYQFGLVTEFASVSALRASALTLGLGGLWLTVTRDDLFEQLPASRTIGRKTAFDASDTAIVVVNNAGNVSDLNSAAQALFGAAELDSIGAPLDSLLPETVDGDALRQAEPITFELPAGNTVVEAAMTTATDDSGQVIGETIVFTDITDERRRQQRIQVLNRVLRHNLRNDLNIAQGYVDVMLDIDDGVEQYQDKIDAIFENLVTMGDKAQRTETVLAANPLSTDSTALSELIDNAIDSIDADIDSIPTTVTVPDGMAVRINPVVLQSIIEELLSNAVRHSGCSEITISYDAEETTLVVADDGSGLPSHEIAVLDNAEETDLEHGSGLGLWLIKWGTDSFGGTATFDTDATGTRVRVEIPPDLVEEPSPT
ncbi:ATP-binding protein [Halonotius aquaticus]|uniref:ATP-binding protein n=1 Tax=Halonotius aquaticus TaxID=2216978 RepID=UPI0014026546|nr:ATP-binding protein [Halonotius aquaticus]